jgi:4-coumarate--CoA ligase
MEEMMKSNYDEVHKVWKGYTSPYPFDKNVYLGEKIIENLKSDPKKLLLISHDEQKCLYADEFLTSIVRVAQNLTNLGITSNDVVGLVCLNSITTYVIINACILIGAPINPLDPMFNVEDITHMFQQTQPKLIVCDYDVYLKVESAIKLIKSDAMMFTIGGKIAGAKCFEELFLPTGIEDEFVSPKFEEPADEKILGMICSSGTTGLSKAVSLSHALVVPYFNYYKNSPPSRSLTFSTAYWLTGFYPCVTIGFPHKDIRVITKQRFSIELLTEIVVKYEVTIMVVPPSQLMEMVQFEKFINCSHSLNWIYAVGSIVSASLREKFKSKFPTVRFNVAYGMTEYSVTLPIGVQPSTSVGNILNGNSEVIIVDDDGNRLGIGETGELRVKNPIKFLGYYGNEKATEEAYDEEGFFKSGDIGYFDKEGHLHIIDRKKDIIKYKGYQYNPSEIEDVIEMIEGVKFVSVVGVPDDSFSYLPTAVIVKQQGFQEILTEDAVKKFVESKLPINKQLHGGVIFVKQLPMTASGKIQKRKVLEMIKTKI